MRTHITQPILLLIYRANSEEKIVVFDFGVILLEIISGKQINTKNEVSVIQNQV